MKMKKTSLNTTKVTDRKIKRLYLVAATVVAAAFVMAMPAFADDPLTTINNLSDFVFSAIKAIGAILLGFGIVQIGLALKGHDASQRAQGFMTFFGGVVIYFAKDILGYDSVSDAVSLTFMLNKRIIFSVKVNSREGVCYGFYNEDYRVGFPK